MNSNTPEPQIKTPAGDKESHPVKLFLLSMLVTLVVVTVLCAGIFAIPQVRSAFSDVLAGYQSFKPAPLISAAAIVEATPEPTITPSAIPPTPDDPAEVAAPNEEVESTDTPQPTATLDPANWQVFPIIPNISRTVRAIYLKGQAMGNNPAVFSKIGDCNSLPPYYLTYFDMKPSSYNLGIYTYLQPAIDQFSGSFKQTSEAVGDGYNTSTILSTLFTDPGNCALTDSPLACEYRARKPSFAIIAIGTDDYISAAKYEANMRKVLDTTINQGIVPILVTKMDNANEMDDNVVLAKLAEEYDIPLINLWAALQPLPKAGLTDKIHPTGVADAFVFSQTNLSTYGWPVRNLTILQGLFATWKSATQQ